MFMSQCYNRAALHESDKLQLDTLKSIHIFTEAQRTFKWKSMLR